MGEQSNRVLARLAERGISLNEQQRQALTQLEGPVLLLAVPGAGKTTVLAARVAHMLLDRGVAPGELLILTFSRESARDMAARFSALFGDLVPKPPRFSTIHSFCFGVLRRYAADRGQPVPTLIEGENAPVSKNRLLRDCYLQVNGEYPDEDQVEELARLYTYYINRQQKPLDSDGQAGNLQHLSQVLERYRQQKKQNGWIDYDDLLTYTMGIFRSRPDLLAEFQARCRYVLLDEAQDTSRIQHAIIDQLAAREQNLFLVGDEDQSIYSFRGAYPQGLLQFPQRHPGAVVLKMEENFRSTKEIVTRADRIIRGNKARYPKEMVTRREQGRLVGAAVLEEAGKLADWLVGSLADLAPGESAAILYRNNPSSIALIDRFDRVGLPFYIKDKPSRLTRQGVVQDVLSILTLYYNPDDLAAFGRIYYKVGAYISRKMYDYVVQHRLPGENVFDVAAQAAGENGNTARLMMLKYTIQKFGTMSPQRILQTIYYDFDYLEFLGRCSQSGMYLELSSQKLRALEAIAASTPNIDLFIERVESIDQIIKTASQRQGCPLTLSTIHSAKGMEFDRVYLIDLQEGILPSTAALDRAVEGDPDLLEEERRLFYVALTRARNRLEVVSCRKYGTTSLSPSRFLAELNRVQPDDSLWQGIRVGRMLQHRYFGRGTIIRVDFEKQQLAARFGKMGEKVFTFAILEDDTLARLLDEGNT